MFTNNQLPAIAPLTINRLNVANVLPELPLQVLVVEVLGCGVALGAGLVIIFLHRHRLLLHVELLVEALLARDELQDRVLYHDVDVVEIVAGSARDPFSWRYDLSERREKHFHYRALTSFPCK